MHVALIGASGFGRHHLEGLHASPYVSRISLAGRNPDPLEAMFHSAPKVVRTTSDYREVLGDPDVSLVDIVLPHDLHLPVALEAFSAGKHVIVEKPPARNLAEFDSMKKAAEWAGRRLFVVMNLLFTPEHQAIRHAIDAGRIGEPFLSLEVNLSSAQAIYADTGNWRADRVRCGGGLLIDGGFHAVYRQLFFLEKLGAPTRLTADIEQIGVSEPTKGEDFSALTLAYPSGARVHLMSQWTARSGLGRFPSGILGTEGSLLLGAGADSAPVLRRPHCADEPLSVGPGPRGFAESVAACVAHYVECVAACREPAVGLDLPTLTLEIITGAYQAALEGRRLKLATTFRTRFDRSGVVVAE